MIQWFHMVSLHIYTFTLFTRKSRLVFRLASGLGHLPAQEGPVANYADERHPMSLGIKPSNKWTESKKYD